jgi:hypothetical protein
MGVTLGWEPCLGIGNVNLYINLDLVCRVIYTKYTTYKGKHLTTHILAGAAPTGFMPTSGGVSSFFSSKSNFATPGQSAPMLYRGYYYGGFTTFLIKLHKTIRPVS